MWFFVKVNSTGSFSLKLPYIYGYSNITYFDQNFDEIDENDYSYTFW